MQLVSSLRQLQVLCDTPLFIPHSMAAWVVQVLTAIHDVLISHHRMLAWVQGGRQRHAADMSTLQVCILLDTVHASRVCKALPDPVQAVACLAAADERCLKDSVATGPLTMAGAGSHLDAIS